eukprot:TRINITY_DN668_c1_g1_i1.p1 TRINITY_DN668_c1_g1~~TRINITY_DN668_c1_g1_i1.p1  ORF type:complete len:343 (-),score=6.25 TRINITY_DN668_c1_g1_i1:106-1065(-)
MLEEFNKLFSGTSVSAGVVFSTAGNSPEALRYINEGTQCVGENQPKKTNDRVNFTHLSAEAIVGMRQVLEETGRVPTNECLRELQHRYKTPMNAFILALRAIASAKRRGLLYLGLQCNFTTTLWSEVVIVRIDNVVCPEISDDPWPLVKYIDVATSRAVCIYLQPSAGLHVTSVRRDVMTCLYRAAMKAIERHGSPVLAVPNGGWPAKTVKSFSENSHIGVHPDWWSALCELATNANETQVLFDCKSGWQTLHFGRNPAHEKIVPVTCASGPISKPLLVCVCCLKFAFNKCRRCKTPYCSPHCQRLDWSRGHKNICFTS